MFGTRVEGCGVNRQRSPFMIGDRVRGISYVPAERMRYETAEAFEGKVVQVGSGYAGVDAKKSYLWVRLPDGTERQALVNQTQLLQPGEEA
jgi:hypothetical protein